MITAFCQHDLYYDGFSTPEPLHDAAIRQMNASSYSQQESLFFKLPFEIRSKIYEDVLDLTLRSPPPTRFFAQDYHHVDFCQWPSTMTMKRPKTLQRTATDLFLTCKKAFTELEQVLRSRKARGKPNCRMDLLVLDDAVWVTRTALSPLLPDKHHDVEMHIRFTNYVDAKNWYEVSHFLLMSFWVQLFLQYGPCLEEMRTSRKEEVPLSITVKLSRCLDDCEDHVNERGACVHYWDLMSRLYQMCRKCSRNERKIRFVKQGQSFGKFLNNSTLERYLQEA